MKKLSLLTCTCVLAFSASAQNIFPSSGNVGIGTTSPSYSFDNRGDSRFAGFVYLTSDDQEIQFYRSGAIYGYLWSTANGLHWGKGNNTNSINIDNSGRVGIGTNTPSEKLVVDGNAVWTGFNSGNARALKIGYSGGNYGGIGYNVDFTASTGVFNRPISDKSSYLQFTSGGFSFFGTATAAAANNISLNGGGDNLNHLATLSHTGNFGIGTDNPTARLQVVGNTSLTTLIRNENTTHGYGLAIESEGSDVTRYALTVRNLAGDNTYFHVSTVTGQVGHVGIGTTNPTEKLSVNGTIRSKEVKVEAANWPDYVFEEGYKVEKLEVLEGFIKANKHLPGIPSAKEVEKEGVSLGEMNVRLLQKIEEMTLQMIEMNKRINELELGKKKRK